MHAFFFFFFFFLSSVDFFFKINFFKKSFKNTIRVSNSLDPDQARHVVRPDLGPKLFAKVISRRQKLPLAGKDLRELDTPERFYAKFFQL